MGCFVQLDETGVCPGGGQHSMARHLTKQEHHMSGVVRARQAACGRLAGPLGRSTDSDLLAAFLLCCRIRSARKPHCGQLMGVRAQRSALKVPAPPCIGDTCTKSCRLLH